MPWRKNKKVQNFFRSYKKEIRKDDKDGNDVITAASYKIKFIDSTRFTRNSLSNHLDDLAEGIHKIKCQDCNRFLESESVNDNLIKYKCLSCNKSYLGKVDKKIIDINKLKSLFFFEKR